MTDLEKLASKYIKRVCIEEITTKREFYNCFGEKIDEQITTTSKMCVFDNDKCEWVQWSGGGINNGTR